VRVWGLSVLRILVRLVSVVFVVLYVEVIVRVCMVSVLVVVSGL